jgi:formate hydrogenlyase transcriptional activator
MSTKSRRTIYRGAAIDANIRTEGGAGTSRSATLSDFSAKGVILFERMLAELSTRFANVPAERVETEIKKAQMMLQKVLALDRCCFSEFQADGSLVVLSSNAVTGVEPTPLGVLPAQLGWFFNKLRTGNLIVISDAGGDLPPEAAAEAEFCRRTGLVSHVAIPLRVGGRVIGDMAFTACRDNRTWPEELTTRLKLVGDIFAQALTRKREKQKLLGALAEINVLREGIPQENTFHVKKMAHDRPPQGLVSRSKCFLSVIEAVAQVAQTNSTVLLLGETGSGKEVVAQAIHDASAQNSRPMIKVNCAALPASLIESEMFGREKGAFTGALARQPGRFELADRSTIFLDEIGELPIELQPKLLRALQEGEFERLGSSKTIRVNARVIAATNRKLEQAVKDGRFREDLFYRLNVFPIEVPPLRERREDIPMLSWTFVREFSNSMGKPIERISEETIAALEGYHWPGNIRELRNVIERAMIVERSQTLSIPLGQATSRAMAMKATAGSFAEAERAIILQALDHCNWRIRGAKGAAALLDIKPTTLESRIKKLGLVRKS